MEGDLVPHYLTYLADTYVYGDFTEPVNSEFVTEDMTSISSREKWKHVLSHGFPSYRASHALLTNPSNGRMYLYGGYATSEYIPDNKDHSIKNYSDLWQLRLNISGGMFEEVGGKLDEKSSAAGPWKRCFTCG